MHKFHLAFEARSFHDRIEDLPMERGDFPPSLQMRPIPRDEIGTVCKRGRKGGESPAFQASIIRRWMARIVSSSAAVCAVGCEFMVAPRNSFAVLVDIGRSSALESEQPRCAYIASRCNGVVQDAHLGE